MKILTLTKVSKTRIEAKLSEGEKIILNYQITVTSKTQQKKLAGDLDIDIDELLGLISEAEIGSPVTVEVLPPEEPPFHIRLRGRQQQANEGLELIGVNILELVETHLTNTRYHFPEPLIEWDGTDRLAILDIDYHHQTPPLPAQIESWCTALTPAPLLYFVSHGGGAKLLYKNQDYISAAELAAAAAIDWQSTDSTAEFEICQNFRHPGYPRTKDGQIQHCGKVRRLAPTTDLSALRLWFSAKPDAAEIAEYLNSQNLIQGHRYPHTQCQIDPYPTASDTPVFVGDEGIFCHVCHAKGKGFAGRPGFISYASILGKSDPHIHPLVQNMTHWTHAQHILVRHVNAQKSILKAAYSALLKVQHGDDPRVPGVFSAGKNLLRVDHRWIPADGTGSYSKQISPILASLPACQRVDEDGAVKASPVRVAQFNESVDLSQFGYPGITPVRGIEIFGTYCFNERTKYPMLINNPKYQSAVPRYLSADKRMPKDEVVQMLASIFPGIDIKYLTFLLCMKGCIEGGTAVNPFILVQGPSGTGKTGTPQIAASICGDHCTEIMFDKSVERFRQGLLEGVTKGTFVTVNEIFKTAKDFKLSPITALNPILNMTEDSVSHLLYTGPTRLGTLPALVLTDTRIPPMIALDTQISRRVFCVKLTQRHDWASSMAAFGVQSPNDLRRAYPELCDAFVSWVIDEYFQQPRSLDQLGKNVGVLRLEELGESEDPKTSLYQLFYEVGIAPEDITMRSAGGGWRLIKPSDQTTLRDAWDAVCDGENGDDWLDSRRCSEASWTTLLGTEKPVYFDLINPKARQILVRFRQGNYRKPDKTNLDIPIGQVSNTVLDYPAFANLRLN